MDKMPNISSITQTLTSEIENRLQELESNNFVHIEMQITPPEQDSLDRIRIEHEVEAFDSYGPVGDDLKERIVQHLGSVGQNDVADIEHVANIINRLAMGVQKGFAKEAVWIAVRVSLPNSTFDIPRWHPDGAYFTSEPGEKTYKFVAALQGAPTLFGRIRDEEVYRQLETISRENQLKNQGNPEALEAEESRIRRELVKVIEPLTESRPTQATIYLVGHEEAVIHSEPPIHEPRIFVSVLPGSREQIDEWSRGSE